MNKEHKALTFIEEIRTLSHWKGSRDVIANPQYIHTGDKLVYTTLLYPPSLVKCIDEVVVNAIDHWHESKVHTSKVTEIKISFDTTNGRLIVENNGDGIPYEEMVVNIETGEKKYKAEALASIRSTTSNSILNKGYDPDKKVTGGVNGIGLKASIADTVSTELETIDISRKIFYRQRFYPDSITIRADPPLVVNLSKRAEREKYGITDDMRRPHTKFTLDLNYSLFPDFKAPESFAILDKWIKSRACMAALFAEGVRVYYNNIELETDLETTLHNTVDGKVYRHSAVTTLSHKLYPWRVGITVVNRAGDISGNLSIVNGIIVREGGHIDLIYKLLANELKPKIDELVKKIGGKYSLDLIRNSIHITMIGQIPSPAWCSFDSQSKTKLDIVDKAKHNFTEYKFDPKFIAELWPKIAEYLEEILSSKKRVNNVRVNNYTPADLAGTKESYKCKLFIPEGSSAEDLVKKLIKKNPVLGSKYCGHFNTVGVPINVRKSTKIVKGRYIESNKLKQNVTYNAMLKILNLSYDKSYKTDAEFRTLHYGQIIIAVDQDTDGVGHICALVLDMILFRWPELVRRGFVKRFTTPIIRAYFVNRKPKVFKDFYYVDDYNKWAPTNTEKVDIRYYKGLASHEEFEVNHMIKNYENNIYTYILDDGAEELIAKVLGEDVAFRKIFLSTPVTDKYNPDTFIKKEFRISEYIKIEVKQFYLDMVHRKIPCIVDGLIHSQRKAIAGALASRVNRPMKVYQITGSITKEMNYAHGDMSMNKLITKMAQTFKGTKTLPLFVPIGNFGSADKGTKEHGHARYISTKLNKPVMDLLFPREDDWLLNIVEDEGKKCEPEYYIPILPLTVIEHVTTPAAGWKINIFARNYKNVIEEVKNRIRNKRVYRLYGKLQLPQESSMRLKICSGRNGGKATECVFGNWSYDVTTNTVHINELPLRVWTEEYIKYLKKVTKCDACKKKKTQAKCKKCHNEPKKAHIEEIRSSSGGDLLDIWVRFKPGAYEDIMANYGTASIHPIEDYLKLYNLLNPSLNFISEEGGVLEFSNYEDIIDRWYPIRLNAYKQRLERKIEVLQLKIELKKNIIRYIELVNTLKLGELHEDTQYQILKDNKFDMLDQSVINNHGRVRYNLREAAYRGDYEYLLCISYKGTSKQALDKNKKELAKLQEELDIVSKTDYRDIWLDEIAQLERVIEEGIATKWRYEDEPVAET